MKYKYNANERSQRLVSTYRPVDEPHAQEINDIRTTLQALYAIYDNCNSLHTNAYDEAITTPTEESVRRAMAIQLIINCELGSKERKPLQGSFLIEELTDLVEEAVMAEFNRFQTGWRAVHMERSIITIPFRKNLYYERLKITEISVG